MPDKFAATWVSHSSIGDFTNCPRSYFLKNMYRSPQSGHKIQIMTPSLALGQIVHQVLEGLSVLPVSERFTSTLLEQYEDAWKSISGEKGGFRSDQDEERYKERGRKMLQRVQQHPGPLKEKAVKLQADLPYYWLSEEDEIILCGKIDWLQYLPEQDAVSILDFKTGKHKEKAGSLQLPIYLLLTTYTQKRVVAGASYWYLDSEDEPEAQALPDLDEAHERVIAIAKKIKVARKLERFVCPQGKQGCRSCQPFEQILLGKAHFVGVGGYKQDIFTLIEEEKGSRESVIL